MTPSKHKMIEMHFVACKSLTAKEAWELYGVYRLASIVNRLRNSGYQIKTEMVEETEHSYARYFIPPHAPLSPLTP